MITVLLKEKTDMKFDAYTIRARLFPFLLLTTPAASLLMTEFSIPFSFFSSIPASLIMCITLVVSIFVRKILTLSSHEFKVYACIVL